MAYSHHLRTGASVASTIYTVCFLIASPTLRATLACLFSPGRHPLRLLALVVAVLLNAKSLPFVWHFRLFGTMLYHLYMQPTALQKGALFRPIITTSMHSCLPECDYNAHKSNSTYFADLDIGRTQLISCLLRRGIRGASAEKKNTQNGNTVAGNGVTLADTSAQNDVPPAKGRYMMALGGVSCHFKREIMPYEGFEIWTRVLSWDRKWIYFISHLVKAGAVKPEEWDLQPWKAVGDRSRNDDASEEEKWKKYQSAIFASSIAKYVVKKGRLTISPEIVLRKSGLLPPNPDDVNQDDVASGDGHSSSAWTWDLVEKQRLHGLKLAENFGSLDELHTEFPVPIASFQENESKRTRLRTLGAFRDFCISL